MTTKESKSTEESIIEKLNNIRKECIKRAGEAENAICVLELQRERLGDIANAIDKLVIELYRQGNNKEQK